MPEERHRYHRPARFLGAVPPRPMISTADRSICLADLSTAWHTRTAADAAERLGSDLQNGLSSEEAARRLAQFGPNEIHEQPPRSLFAMAIAQFRDFMVLVLIAAAIVSGLIGDAEMPW